jgi:hypothetical protein
MFPVPVENMVLTVPAFSPEAANAGTANPRTAIAESTHLAISDFMIFPLLRNDLWGEIDSRDVAIAAYVGRPINDYRMPIASRLVSNADHTVVVSVRFIEIRKIMARTKSAKTIYGDQKITRGSRKYCGRGNVGVSNMSGILARSRKHWHSPSNSSHGNDGQYILGNKRFHDNPTL